MRSLIARAATQLLIPLLLVYSLFLLLRGHNAPGGGFVGGLFAAAAFVVYAIAFGPQAARKALIASPQSLIASGLLTALASALAAPFQGEPFMTGLWTTARYPALGKLGTPLLFDAGVYLVVLGVTLTIILSLAEE